MRVQLASVLGLLLFAVIAPVSGAEDPPKGKKSPLDQQVQRRFELPEVITLADEQKTKLEGIKKEFSSKVKELIEKREAILTAEQKQARQAAQKAARQAGKKQKEIQEAGLAALKLTDEQTKPFSAAEDEIKKIDGEIRGKIAEILTDEQKASLKKAREESAS